MAGCQMTECQMAGNGWVPNGGVPNGWVPIGGVPNGWVPIG